MSSNTVTICVPIFINYGFNSSIGKKVSDREYHRKPHGKLVVEIGENITEQFNTIFSALLSFNRIDKDIYRVLNSLFDEITYYIFGQYNIYKNRYIPLIIDFCGHYPHDPYIVYYREPIPIVESPISLNDNRVILVTSSDGTSTEFTLMSIKSDSPFEV